MDALTREKEIYIETSKKQLEALNKKLTILNNSYSALEDKSRQQNEVIEKLTYQLEELQDQKDKLHSNFENICIQFNKQVIIGYIIGSIGAVLALITFLI